MALPAADLFSAATTQSLTAYSPNWTILEGSLDVNANGRCFGTGAGYNTARWNADTFGADQYAQTTLDNNATGSVYCGPAVRCQSGANSSYHCEGSGTSVYLSKCLAGTQSTLLGPITVPSLAAGDVLRLEVRTVGGNAQLRVFHAPVASPASFTQIGSTYTDSTSPILTAGHAGVFAYGANNDIGFTAWEANDLASPPSAPGSCTLTATTPDSFSVAWTDSSSDETGFEVQWSVSPYSTWTALSGSPAAANATSLASGDGVATPTTTIKSRVRSVNGAGQSAWVESSAVTMSAWTYSRPLSDGATKQWSASTGTDHYALLDETSADDNDYIVALSTGLVDEINFSMVAPVSGSSFRVRYRLTGIAGGAAAIVKLYLGASLVKTDTTRTSDGTYVMTVTSSDYAGATTGDWASAKLRLESA